MRNVREEEMTDCSTYIASDKDWHWKKPTEVIKLRKKKRLSTLDKKSKENSATSLAVKEAPPLTKPNPFRTKRSEIKSLEKGIKESVLYQEVLLKVRTYIIAVMFRVVVATRDRVGSRNVVWDLDFVCQRCSKWLLSDTGGYFI